MKTATGHSGLRRGGDRMRAVRVCAAMSLGWLSLLCTVAIAEPVEVQQITRELPAGPIQVFVAKIDLKDPALKIVSDGPLNAADKKNPKAEAKLVRTDEWARARGTTLAINANYFGLLEKAPKPATPNEDNHGYARSLEADVIGVFVSDGVVVSEPRVVDGEGDPAVIIRKDGTAVAKRVTAADLNNVAFAVAGVGVSGTKQDKYPGTLLVQGGKNMGSTARVDAEIRHPRTALGVSADGTRLVVMVVDGRAPGYSVGVTLPELADLMIEQGAADAINLDGGGSSAFVYTPMTSHPTASERESKVVLNRPSDGSFRPVANHLGFVVVGREDPSVQLPASGALPKVEDPNPTGAK